MYATEVAALHSTWWYANNAAAARRFWKPAATANFVSEHSSSLGSKMCLKKKWKKSGLRDCDSMVTGGPGQ